MNGPTAAVVIFFLLMCVKCLLLSLTPLLRYDTDTHTHIPTHTHIHTNTHTNTYTQGREGCFCTCLRKLLVNPGIMNQFI